MDVLTVSSMTVYRVVWIVYGSNRQMRRVKFFRDCNDAINFKVKLKESALFLDVPFHTPPEIEKVEIE